MRRLGTRVAGPIGGVGVEEQRLWRCRRETIRLRQGFLLRATRYEGQDGGQAR